jgi:hypothetical protein
MANWNFIYSMCYTQASLSQACCSLNENTMDFCVLSASQHHDRVALLLPETAETPDTDFVQCLARTFGQIIFVLLYTQHWVLMNSLGGHGNLSVVYVMKKVMVTHNLMKLSNFHKVMTALCCCVTFKLLLCRFLCSFLDMLLFVMKVMV